MLAIAIWMFGLAIGISALLLATAAEQYGLHLVLTGIVSGFIAIKTLREQRLALSQTAHPAEFARITIRHLGLIWIWSVLAIVTTYSLLVEWTGTRALLPPLLLGAGLCSFIGMVLAREAEQAEFDARMLMLVSGVFASHLVVACLGLGVVLAAGTTGSASGASWAAINVLAASGIAMALVSASALKAALELRLAGDAAAPA